MKYWLSLLFALMAGLSVARAQDSGSGGRDVYKLVFENERVRVFEMNFRPGAKVALHASRSQLMYTLTEGSLVFSDANKRPYEMTFKSGEVVWLPGQGIQTQNDSERSFRGVVVEIKEGAARPARAKARAKKGKGKAKGKARSKGRGKR